jgi:hypothetical protein
MNRVLLVLGIAVVAVVRTMWKKPRQQQKVDLRERVNTWENEGGQVPEVPPPRSGR